MLGILLWVSIITHLFVYAVPGDPAQIIAERRYGDGVTRDAVERIERELGFDRPVVMQYVHWIIGAVQGRLGYSFRTGQPVTAEIISRVPSTAALAVGAMLLSLLAAIPAGVVCALRPHSIADSSARLGALLGVSIPNFWLGLLLISVFSLRLGWLPVFGEDQIAHLILPSVTLGTGLAAITTRLVRSSMIQVLKQDYLVCAQAKGVGPLQLVLRHTLKNALLPVLTVVGLQLGSLLAGTVVVEVIFARRGLGRLLYDSVFARDVPVIQGCVLLFVIVHLVINLLVDLSYTWLNPQIRFGDTL